MKKSEVRFVKKWKEKMAMGRLKYGFIEGGIFGLVLGIVTTLLSLLFVEDYIFKNIQLVYDLIIWILGGILGYLTVMWEMKMYYYKTFLKKYGLDE
ncbi:hypothetical protein [Myroides odoratus]|uniref:hypothetical protein n=1 Tax=Myroides odoratus TaxID=256 RepID=UPI0039AF9188